MHYRYTLPRTALVLSMSFFTFIGCSDEEPDFTRPLHGTWKVTSAVINPPKEIDGVVVTDALTILHADTCDADNLMIFATAGSYTDDAGPLRCPDEDQQQVEGSYIYQGTTLTIEGGLGQNMLQFTNVNINGDVMTFSGVPQKLLEHTPINVNFRLEKQ